MLRFSVPNEGDRTRAIHFSQARFIDFEKESLPIEIEQEGQQWMIRLPEGSSGCLHLPWRIEGFGEVVVRTASLMNREEPYRLSVELARGELNQVRNQLAECDSNGMPVSETFHKQLGRAHHCLLQAIHASDLQDSERKANEVLRLALWSGEELTKVYRDFILTNHRSQQRPPALLGCVVDPKLTQAPATDEFRETFDHLSVPLYWRLLEPCQGEYDWQRLDQQIDWCTRLGLPFTVGPLLDLRPEALPDWLSGWGNDIQSMVTVILNFVETCVGRYQGKVNWWETTARANSVQALSLSEEQLLWLTARMISAGRGVDPLSRFAFCVDRPWGEYQLEQDAKHSPQSFTDWLIRTDCEASAVIVEVAMGYSQGGCFCRNLSNFSQILDSFEELGLPVRLRLCFPSGKVETGGWRPEAGDWKGEKKKSSASSLQPPASSLIGAGLWHDEPSERIQADWLEAFVGAALIKPFVEVVTWARYHDPAGEDWPLSGLATAEGKPKSALDRIRELKKTFRPLE